MRNLPPTAIILLCLTTIALLVSCEDGGAPDKALLQPWEIALPTPAVEPTRPIANTSLTYFHIFELEWEDRRQWLEMAEVELLDLAETGIEFESVWMARYFSGWCNSGAIGVAVTVRLAEPNASIEDCGFVANPVVTWREAYCLERETWHYVFREAPAADLPECLLEMARWTEDTELMYHHYLFDRYPVPDEVFRNADAFLATLVAEGVGILNAWVYFSYKWEGYDIALAVEVDAPHPVIETSALREVPPYEGFGGPVWWRYCFESSECPVAEPLPEPDVTWLAPLFPAPAIYYRSVPSTEYESLIGGEEDAEKELQRLVRGGLEVSQAWIPAGAADAGYTSIVIELAVDDHLVVAWGYEESPAGDPPDFPWSYVWHYDLRPEERAMIEGARVRPHVTHAP